jgi:hypothetical protein
MMMLKGMPLDGILAKIREVMRLLSKHTIIEHLKRVR